MECQDTNGREWEGDFVGDIGFGCGCVNVRDQKLHPLLSIAPFFIERQDTRWTEREAKLGFPKMDL